jgi:phytoene synthase
MRIVDDRIDGLLARKQPTATERRRELKIVNAWERLVSACLAGSFSPTTGANHKHHPDAEALHTSLTTAAERFQLPSILWHNFFAAMRTDLERTRFATYGEFIRYAEGAAVAPTTIYLYLIASERANAADVYRPPRGFNLMQIGRDLGLFAYITHVLRDLRADLSAGANGLLYLATDDMTAHRLTRRSLLSSLAAGSSGTRLRALVREMADRAKDLAERGRADVRRLRERLSPDRAFVLELIVRIYECQLEKIVRNSHDVMQGKHTLTDREKEAVAAQVAAEMGVRPGLRARSQCHAGRAGGESRRDEVG